MTNNMTEKFFKLMELMAKKPEIGAIVGQLWANYNKDNNLFEQKYIRLEKCHCFETDIRWVFTELGYPNIDCAPIENKHAIYVIINRDNL